MKYLISVDFSNFDSSSIKSMVGIFYLCESLKSIDFSNFDSSSLLDVGVMFRG